MTHKFHNRILNKFSENYYGRILDKNNLVEEIVIEDFPFWYALMGGTKYLLDREIVCKLPIKITETQEVHYSKKVYYRVVKYQTVVFKQEKNHTFKQVVDSFCDFEHSNKEHYTLYKILAFGSYFDRMNFRVATNAGFGKDSVWEALHILRRDVSVINPRSMPALEYRLLNKVLVLNELSNVDGGQRDLIQEFLLLCGDMRTTYEKSTRAGSKTHDYYNIKNLSIIIMFNDFNYYKEIGKEKKFFDNQFTRAVLDRFLPFKFEGRLESKQFMIDESESKTLNEHQYEYIRLLRSVEYYKHHWRAELKPYSVKTQSLGLSPREQQNITKAFQFVNLYSQNKEEYETLCKKLYDCHLNYKRMVKEGNTLLDGFVTEMPLQVEEVNMTNG